MPRRVGSVFLLKYRGSKGSAAHAGGAATEQEKLESTSRSYPASRGPDPHGSLEWWKQLIPAPL